MLSKFDEYKLDKTITKQIRLLHNNLVIHNNYGDTYKGTLMAMKSDELLEFLSSDKMIHYTGLNLTNQKYLSTAHIKALCKNKYSSRICFINFNDDITNSYQCIECFHKKNKLVEFEQLNEWINIILKSRYIGKYTIFSKYSSDGYLYPCVKIDFPKDIEMEMEYEKKQEDFIFKNFFYCLLNRDDYIDSIEDMETKCGIKILNLN